MDNGKLIKWKMENLIRVESGEWRVELNGLASIPSTFGRGWNFLARNELRNSGEGFKIFLKSLIIFLVILLSAMAVNAESLFMMGVSQDQQYIEPKSLYASVRARTVGDLITIIMEESVTVSDALTYNSNRQATTTNNFTGLLNSVLPGKPITNQVSNFGGGNKVDSTSKNNRAITFKDNVTAQVVQLLPNGNLVVQGKKTLINTNERVDLLMSGVVDPRWINDMGQVSSRNVANLQFAMNGNGTTTRAGGEGIINRIIRYLF